MRTLDVTGALILTGIVLLLFSIIPAMRAEVMSRYEPGYRFLVRLAWALSSTGAVLLIFAGWYEALLS